MYRHRCAMLIPIGLAVIFIGVRTLLASNMGFIVSCPLTSGGPASRSGTHTLNLPYQRDAGLLRVGDVMTDLGFINVANIATFLEASDALFVYTGRKGDSPPNSLLVSGECHFVKMNSTVDYVIGGGSDPQTVLNLNAAGPGSLTGTNFVGIPYHAIARTASELMHDIGFAHVANVQRFLTQTDSLQVYTGRKGSPPDFPLEPCQCYFIKMNTSVNYIPRHY
jgi:hypothetical protein